jgi:hypothetical protein
MFCRCRHDYEILDKHVLVPPLEFLLGRNLEQITRMDASSDLLRSAIIYVLKCRLCKKVVFRREDNPKD